MKSLINLAIFAFLSGTCFADTIKVTIYYVPWSVTTAVAMSADRVRSNAVSVTTISEPVHAQRFVKWLNEDEMTDEPKWKVQDLRLVIDALQQDGSIATYSASRFGLISERTGKIRLIGDSFRAKFSFYSE